MLDESALDGTRPWADVVKEAELPMETIDGPFGQVTYLPSLIEMADVRPGFDRSTQPLGSSPLTSASAARG